MTQFTSCSVAIEHTAGNWTDYTGRLRMPVSIRRGRATMWEDVGAGVFTASFNNHDGDLMPDLIGTTGYPNLVEFKRLRFQVTKGATTYTRFLGWISNIAPEFPDTSLAQATCTITAVDSLALLAQKKLRSNWTEQNLWQARSASVEADAWEPTNQVNGFFAALTNFTENAGHPGPVSVYVSNAPALSFTSDSLSSFGQVISVNPDSSDHTCTTKVGISTGSLAIMLMFKSPKIHTPNVSTPYTFATLLDSGGTKLANLTIKDNAGTNAFIIYDGTLATNLGIVGNVGFDQWHVVNMSQNATTATQMDFGMVRCVDGVAPTLNGLNIDIRNVFNIELPGFQGNVMAHSSGGIIALKRRGPLQNYQQAVTTGGTTMGERMTSLAGACARLPVAFTQVGDWGALAVTGDWAKRTALEVGQEICRSTRDATDGSNGLMFARPRDSQVLAISGNITHPTNPTATLDWEADLLVGSKTTSSVDGRPTRVTVSSPRGSVTSVDTAAESGGESRELTVTTINQSGFSDASDIAAFLLRRNKQLNFSKVKIDLVGCVNDPTAPLFDESGTNSGLFPSAKLRIVNLPVSHFTYPTRDIWAQGWTEVFDSDAAWIDADTISSQVITRTTENFTGTDGSAFPAQWLTGITGAGGTCLLASNRGRITPGTTSNSYTGRYLNVGSRVDGEFTGSVVLGSSASRAYAWAKATTDLVTGGYSIRMTCDGNIYLEQKISGVLTVLATASFTMTAGTQYGWRIRIVDKYINARVWQWGFAEQKSWHFMLQDSGVVPAGVFGIAAINDGTNATARTADFDDIVLTDAGSGA